MELQRTNKQQNITHQDKHLTALIKVHQSDSNRCVSLEKLWDNKEPSFKAIEIKSGKSVVSYILRAELYNIADAISVKVTPNQIEHAVRYIMNDYYSYSISDLTVITNRILKTKKYSSEGIRDITSEIDQYSIEKQEYAVYQRQKENGEHKADNAITNAKILKTYESMKKIAQEPIQTQKEKDAIAREVNEEKIKELQKLYPKTH